MVAVKPVDLVLVSYRDEYNVERTQLGVVGENSVHLLEGRSLGFSSTTTPTGPATKWLRDGIFKMLGRLDKEEKKGAKK